MFPSLNQVFPGLMLSTASRLVVLASSAAIICHFSRSIRAVVEICPSGAGSRTNKALSQVFCSERWMMNGRPTVQSSRKRGVPAGEDAKKKKKKRAHAIACGHHRRNQNGNRRKKRATSHLWHCSQQQQQQQQQQHYHHNHMPVRAANDAGKLLHPAHCHPRRGGYTKSPLTQHCCFSLFLLDSYHHRMPPLAAAAAAAAALQEVACGVV